MTLLTRHHEDTLMTMWPRYMATITPANIHTLVGLFISLMGVRNGIGCPCGGHCLERTVQMASNTTIPDSISQNATLTINATSPRSEVLASFSVGVPCTG